VKVQLESLSPSTEGDFTASLAERQKDNELVNQAEFIPLDEISQQLFRDQIGTSLFELIESNCRQATALRGSPEYASVVRMGKLLGSFLISSAKGDFIDGLVGPNAISGILQDDEDAVITPFELLIPYFLRYFSPVKFQDGWLFQLVVFLRRGVVPYICQLSAHNRYTQASKDFCEVLIQLLALLFGDGILETITPELLLVKEHENLPWDGLFANFPTHHRLLPWLPSATHFVDLPYELIDFFVEKRIADCCTKCTVKASVAICLNCGSQHCSNFYCSQSLRKHPKEYVFSQAMSEHVYPVLISSCV
jgi:hypothetical protein